MKRSWVLFVFRTLGLADDYKGMSMSDNGTRYKNQWW